MNTKLILIIMDGWGEAPSTPDNAISEAKTPFVDSLYKKYPHSHLLTSGEHVGLPEGQMGNSEVGHLNLGAGRVVHQELALINLAIKNGSIDNNKVLLETFSYCLSNKKDLHLMGLVSDGGVHSHVDHLIHLCKLAYENGVSQIYIHAFMDGRDTDPRNGLDYIKYLEKNVIHYNAKVVSVIGRYYAMDRDKRWERVKLAYDLMVSGSDTIFDSAEEGIRSSYNNGITDEFILPFSVKSDYGDFKVISPDDAVICFNFRTDRCREITQVLTQDNLPDYNMHTLPLHYVTMTNYDDSYKKVKVVFGKENYKNTLGEVLSDAGNKQLRIAETEKYPHVTFFFSGGREDKYDGEDRIMIASPKVATYDLKPEMNAFEVTDKLIAEVKQNKYDFICLNFANPDMVGHTGVKTAIIKAVETVDSCVSKIVEAGLKNDYSFIITSDHGNADKVINEDGTPNTAHTTNPVPCFLIHPSNPNLQIKDGKLADIAPTILKLMNIEIPKEMTGEILV